MAKLIIILTDLHLHFELVLQHTVEFLNVMLEERIQGLPAERLRQLGRACSKYTWLRVHIVSSLALRLTNWLIRGL